MRWSSIVIIVLIISYLVNIFRIAYLIRKVQISDEQDHIKDEKTYRLKSNARTVGIFMIVIILLLFFVDLVDRNL